MLVSVDDPSIYHCSESHVEQGGEEEDEKERKGFIVVHSHSVPRKRMIRESVKFGEGGYEQKTHFLTPSGTGSNTNISFCNEE